MSKVGSRRLPAPRCWATASVVVASLAAAASASALSVPVSRVHAVAQTYVPGVLLPTVLPHGVNRVSVAKGGAVGSAPRPARTFAYLAGSRQAFQVTVWRGARRGPVLKGLRSRDGYRSSTQSFSAGRFSGTVESAKSADASVAGPVSYVWEDGEFTYMLAFVAKPGTTAPSFPGLNATRTIASFKR